MCYVSLQNHNYRQNGHDLRPFQPTMAPYNNQPWVATYPWSTATATIAPKRRQCDAGFAVVCV
eukprot:scaffold31297_cov66-Cyclotella_meneghiniana.AAC.6